MLPNVNFAFAHWQFGFGTVPFYGGPPGFFGWQGVLGNDFWVQGEVFSLKPSIKAVLRESGESGESKICPPPKKKVKKKKKGQQPLHRNSMAFLHQLSRHFFLSIATCDAVRKSRYPRLGPPAVPNLLPLFGGSPKIAQHQKKKSGTDFFEDQPGPATKRPERAAAPRRRAAARTGISITPAGRSRPGAGGVRVDRSSTSRGVGGRGVGGSGGWGVGGFVFHESLERRHRNGERRGKR